MNNMRLVVSIINFLKDECQKKEITEDTRESLEVAIQCLQTAYDLKPEDLQFSSLQISRPLVDLFNAVEPEPEPCTPDLSPEVKIEAERFKNLGNTLMKSDKIEDAVEAYTQAIKISSGNAVYYCNRAAAYSKLANYKAAIHDCERAVTLDSKYSKAYGRMGLAYSSLGDTDKAIECYRKAVELDPTNESCRTNLQIAEEKKKADGDASVTSSGPNSPMDIPSLLSNPVLRNMASTVMQDPNIYNLMSGVMANTLEDNGGVGGMDALLRAGQRLAAQMQASNPQLVEQLRQQFSCENPQNSENNDSSSK